MKLSKMAQKMHATLITYNYNGQHYVPNFGRRGVENCEVQYGERCDRTRSYFSVKFVVFNHKN